MAASTSTIVAIATGSTNAGIGVVRLSGPASLAAALSLVGRSTPPKPRVATRVNMQASAQWVDQGLMLWFPAPHSFTGEDVVELHCHGSTKLLSMLLDELTQNTGVRLAQAGEFTRRALLNGKIDLAQAEAVGWLVSASSEQEVTAAAQQLNGALGHALEGVWSQVLALKAEIEGRLDFPEESEDTGFEAVPEATSLLKSTSALLAAVNRGALLRKHPRVVLYGPVNAGKSTLFNRLVGAPRALVDAEAGTTRDVLEAQVVSRGVSLTWVDTAGLREDAGRLERLGIERAQHEVRAADLAVLLVPPEATGLEVQRWQAMVEDSRRVDVLTQCDRRAQEPLFHVEHRLSAHSGFGVEAFERAVCGRLGLVEASAVFSASALQAQQLQTLQESAELILAAAQHQQLEVMAGELGAMLDALAAASGKDAGEELLDAVFQRFCIGK